MHPPLTSVSIGPSVLAVATHVRDSAGAAIFVALDYDDIATACGIKPDTAYRALRKLDELGAIQVVEFAHGAATLCLLPGWVWDLLAHFEAGDR
jgi:hypothetical protein